MKNNLVNQDIKTDKPLALTYEALKAERDASLNAERVWETSMMAVCGQDGPASVAAVIEALLAENVRLKAAMHPESIPDDVLDVFTDTVTYDYESCDAWSWAWVKNTDEVIKAVMNAMHKTETPATSAALAAIEARGVEKFAAWASEQESMASDSGDKKEARIYCQVEARAKHFSKQLREAK